MSILKYYALSAVRGFARNRLTTAVNLLSLSLGLIGFVAAYLVATDMLSVGSRYPGAERTFVLTVTMEGGIGLRGAPITPAPLARYLQADLPELDAVARAASAPVELAVAAGDRKLYRQALFADAAYLELFPEAIEADAANPLAAPRSAVISSDSARALFGEPRPLGRSFRLAGRVDVTVAGVFSEPVLTHLGNPTDMVVSMDTANFLTPESTGIVPDTPGAPDDWTPRTMITFVRLPTDGSLTASALRGFLADFPDRRIPRDVLDGSEISFDAIPVSRLVVSAIDMVFGGGIGVPITSLIMLVGIAILGMSCLNYANLTAAQTLLRAKQIALTKVFGAKRWQVLVQALIEAVILTTAALVIALSVAEILMPLANSAFAMTMDLPYMTSPGLWLTLGALLAGIGIAAGGYPALMMARIRPVAALRSGVSLARRGRLRRLLVGAQFTTAALLLILVFAMIAHNAQLRAHGINAVDDPLVVVRSALPEGDATREGFAAALSEHAAIVSVSSTGLAPWTFQANDFATLSRGAGSQGAAVNFFLHDVAHGYFETMATRVVAGRVFSRDRGDDEFFWEETPASGQPRPLHIVLDRSAARRLGWNDPTAAVGQTVYRRWSGLSRPAEVIGVVEDTPYKLVGMGIASASVYFLQPDDTQLQLVRVRRDRLDEALTYIDETWNRFAPDIPIRRELSRDLFDEAMAIFDMFNGTFAAMSMFAIFVAAVGLFGAASFATARRIHEIGVRKTLGASRQQILRMLLWSFTKPVLIANLLAWPLGFAVILVYHGLFAFDSRPNAVPFGASLLMTLLIAWVTVAALSLRAARAQPAQVLRQE